MYKLNNSIIENIGNTPLIQAFGMCRAFHISGNLFVKTEGANPGGSIKTRAALGIIEKAERTGKLNQDQTLVIEACGANVALAFAVVCASKGYKLVAVMADCESNDKYSLLHAYGVQVVLTSRDAGIMGAVRKADQLCKKYPKAFRPRLGYNTLTVAAYKQVANEIWSQTKGNVDIVVAGVGSGATVTALGSVLKRKNKNVQIVAVEAEEAQQLISGKQRSEHGIRGISTGEMPLLDTSVIDEVYPVSTSNAFGTSVALSVNDGILVGISAGAALYTAMQLARMPENAEKNIVVIAPDTGERYIDTGMFDYFESYIVVD